MQEEIESQAAEFVGQLVFAFARMDFMLALALRNITLSPTPDDLNPLIERLGFKERLDALRDLVAGSGFLTSQAKKQFTAWYATADRLRTTRNAFVHGRWGMQTKHTLFNASTKVGKAFAGESKLYSLADLAAEARLARQVLDVFSEWHHRNVVNAP